MKMKKFLALSLCASMLLTGCVNNPPSNESNSSNIIDLENSENAEYKSIIENYFNTNITDKVLEKFTYNPNFEQYINTNITRIKIDDCEYSIKETKFSDVIENLKKYSNEDGLKYINNPNQINESGKFNIIANVSGSLSIMFRFYADKSATINEYTLYSFTITQNVYQATDNDKVLDNFECVIPLTLTEEQWEAKKPETTRYYDTSDNPYYIYNNPIGFAIGDKQIMGYSIKLAFDSDKLVYLSYEVNSII